MIDIVLPCILGIVAFVQRFIVVKNAETDFDTYGHLYFAKEVKEQKAGPFGHIATRIVGSVSYRQPFLWHWLIGFLPLQHLLRHQKWINAGIDATFSLLIYFIALRLNLAKQAAFYMVLIYLFTPMWFSGISVGPRINNFTPRLASEIFTNLFFIITLLPLGIPIWLNILTGALLSSFVLLSSKFGLQVLLFLVPFISIIMWNPVPTTALISGLVFTIAMTKGDFMMTIGEQFRHLHWYFRKNIKGEAPISNRNSIKKLFAKPSSGGDIMRHVGLILLRCLSSNSYTSVLFKMPVLAVAFVLYGISYRNGTVGSFQLAIMSPVIAATIIFFLVNFPPLLFLGEAERYLNHVAFFIVATVATLAINLNLIWVLWAILAYGLFYFLVEVLFLKRLSPSSMRSVIDLDKTVIEYLNSIPTHSVILSCPFHAICVWRIMFETKHKVIYAAMTSREFMESFDEKYGDGYPYVKLERLDEMAEEHGINYVITSKSKLLARNLQDWTPSSMWRKLEVGEPVYAIYQRILEK